MALSVRVGNPATVDVCVQVVGWGAGLYDPGGTTWNFDNPMRRDTVTIPSMSFIVIRWMADMDLWVLLVGGRVAHDTDEGL